MTSSDDRAMTGYAFIAAIVSLYVSDALYRTVIAWAKLLPDKLQEERKVSYSIGALIWEPSLPNNLGRKYLLSIAFGAIASFSAAFLPTIPTVRSGRYFLPACFYSRSRMVC